MVSIGTYIITLFVALVLVVAAYFIGENRSEKAVAAERAKLDAYREQLSGYLDHFGDRIGEEAKEHFGKFLDLLKTRFGNLL